MNYFAKDDKGEICFRGAAVMKGYFNDPELTAKTVDKDVTTKPGYNFGCRVGFIQAILESGGRMVALRSLTEKMQCSNWPKETLFPQNKLKLYI